MIASKSADLEDTKMLLDPDRAGADLRDLDLAIGFVDLATWPESRAPWPLPPFPLVGLGPRDHPLAAGLDAIVEPPVTWQGLARSVRRSPTAAAVAVQLLRTIDGLPVADALCAESLAYGVLQVGAEHRAWLAARPPAAVVPPGRLHVERNTGTLRLVIDRPAARNAIDRSLRDALFEAFTLAALDGDIRRIELGSVGKAFSMGADLDEFGTTRDPALAHIIRGRTLPALPLSRCGDRLSVLIQGAAVGAGIEFAAFAGSIGAAPGAWFQLPELAMGVIPGAGGCVSIPRRIGRQRAALMILSGRRIGAETALRWGLIDRIEDEPSA